jgi:hypothetical protein
MKCLSFLPVSLVALLIIALPARADLAPPETEPCMSKQAGAACVYNNAAGTCQNQTCGKTGSTYDCLECIVPSDTNSDGACSIGKQLAVPRVAPWLAAGSFSLLFLFRRRPRR